MCRSSGGRAVRRSRRGDGVLELVAGGMAGKPIEVLRGTISVQGLTAGGSCYVRRTGWCMGCSLSRRHDAGRRVDWDFRGGLVGKKF